MDVFTAVVATVSAVSNLITIAKQLSQLLPKSSARRVEVELFEDYLRLILTELEKMRRTLEASSITFSSASLVQLEEKMKQFEDIARKLRRNKYDLKKDDVRNLRIHVMNTFNTYMKLIYFELTIEFWEDLTARIMRMQPALVLQTNPEIQCGATSPHREEPHRTEDLPQELVNNCNVCEKRLTSASTLTRNSGMEIREEQENVENKLNNPNLSMTFENADSGDHGKLSFSTGGDGKGKIGVTFDAHKANTVGAMVGVSPMKVSKTLGYFYFEVTVVEIAEQHLVGHDVDCSMTGVGVGLVVRSRFKDDRMVGSYKQSIGYNGCSGNVNCEQLVPVAPFDIGKLVKGDTLGIGLLALPATMKKPVVFFRKNGELQQGTHELFKVHREPATHILHPVVSITSCNAKLWVNFDGFFDLPSGADLAAMLDVT